MPPGRRTRPSGIGLPRRAAYLVMAAMLLLTAYHGLGFPLLAGLFSYTVLDLAHRRLATVMRPGLARWLTLGVFVLTAGLAGFFTAFFIRESLATVPVIVESMLPRVAELADEYHIDLPFENIDELRGIVMEWLKENAGNVTHASSLLTTGFFSIMIAVGIAILLFMSPGNDPDRGTLYDALRLELGERVRRFMRSFERVLSAQVVISAINTTLTAVFLLVLGFPYAAFLIPATFIVGLLPVVGNLVSNTLVVGTGLAMSLRDALMATGFLVAIHKGEYFLNSRIIGSSIRAPMWQTLLGILIGEIVLGIPGIILAPAVLHYLRVELQDLAAR